ncbi:MAG: dihydrofolate reductase family protein [Cyclobacteriaceae bacterium]|jgi:dihydrofolate reductase|nr:dihydrofolate reductase family protein [Cyclobacteriaceae bacterium]
MRKIISFMHISLDGFVAGLNGEMDWIKVDEEIFDYVGKRISEGDTALYGRVTYQMMENYWPTAADKPKATKHDIEHSKWYSKVHKVVLSKTMSPDSYRDEGLANTKIISDNLTDRINEIKQSRPASGLSVSKDILLFGSPTATHSLIQLNLIDGYWLFVNPIILGRGIPLFVDIKEKIKLKLLTTRQFTCGVTELNYTVDKQ